jgi:hypothetical protein
MLNVHQIAGAAEQVELLETKKQDLLKPKTPLEFRLGSAERGEFMKITFNISDFDKDKDSKTLSVNVPADLAEQFQSFDQTLQAKAAKVSPQGDLEWRPLVTQEGEREPRISIKMCCKESASTRTRFYTWDGKDKKNGKPEVKETSFEHICAGQRVVLLLNLGHVWSYKKGRGITLYAKHVLIMQSDEEDTEGPDFS